MHIWQLTWRFHGRPVSCASDRDRCGYLARDGINMRQTTPILSVRLQSFPVPTSSASTWIGKSGCERMVPPVIGYACQERGPGRESLELRGGSQNAPRRAKGSLATQNLLICCESLFDIQGTCQARTDRHRRSDLDLSRVSRT